MAWLMLHDCIPFVFELRTAYTLTPCLSLPTLVRQGYIALFVNILSGELITMMKARGYSGEKASVMISIRLVQARDHFIYDLLTLSDLLWGLAVERPWLALGGALSHLLYTNGLGKQSSILCSGK